MSYTHLHTHSQGSILDGASSIEEIVSRTKALGMSSVALTDHGALYFLIEFYKECKKQSIKPILGCEAYSSDDPDDLPRDQRKRDNYHLILLAKNLEGYRNLLWLITNANLHNFYYKPRVSKQALADHSFGLIAQTACLGGEVAQKLVQSSQTEDYKPFQDTLGFYYEVFGDDLYLELQDDRCSDPQTAAFQKTLNDVLIDWSRKRKIPTVITADSHYTCREDKDLHDVVMAIQLKKTLDEYIGSQEMRLPEHCHLVAPEDMLEAAKAIGCEAAFHNVEGLAGKIEDFNPGIGLSKPPSFDFTKAPDYQEFLDYLAE